MRLNLKNQIFVCKKQKAAVGCFFSAGKIRHIVKGCPFFAFTKIRHIVFVKQKERSKKYAY